MRSWRRANGNWISCALTAAQSQTCGPADAAGSAAAGPKSNESWWGALGRAFRCRDFRDGSEETIATAGVDRLESESPFRAWAFLTVSVGAARVPENAAGLRLCASSIHRVPCAAV